LILDSNVVIALLGNDIDSPTYRAIADVRAGHQSSINEIIFAEISMRFRSSAAVERACAALDLSIEPLTLPECHRAGLAFAEYRRGGGQRKAILADFLIGAQAEMRGWPLVTRDRRGFASYFPELELIDPTETDQ
jgi:predicted nucleic acid-binding protein